MLEFLTESDIRQVLHGGTLLTNHPYTVKMIVEHLPKSSRVRMMFQKSLYKNNEIKIMQLDHVCAI